MDNEKIKETLLTFFSVAKDAVGKFITSHIKAIILVLILVLGVVMGGFVLKEMDAQKIASASEVKISLIEGQSYDFENRIISYKMDENFKEFVEVNVDDQKMYALSECPDGVMSIYVKTEERLYIKYDVLVTALNVDLHQDVSIVRGGQTSIKDLAVDYSLEWSSSDEAIATVDQRGNITGIALGKCDIIAKITSDIAITYHVSVVDVALSPANEYLYVGDSLNYTVLGYDPSANERMSVESSDPSVASAKGMSVQTNKAGSATISFTLNGKSFTSVLTVLNNPSVEDVSLSINSETDLVATNIPSWDDCEEIKVDAENIAVYENGKIKAIGLGTTQLHGKIKGRDFSCNITVTGTTLIPDTNAVYDTNFNKYNAYSEIEKYSVKENETLRIYFSNAASQVPAVKTSDNNFRVFDTTNEYVEIVGTNPGVGLLAVDFAEKRLYAEVHVQHTHSTVTQRQWEVELKTFTDSLKKDGDWVFSEDVHGTYVEAKSDLERRINGISLVNYTLQELKIFGIENFLTIGENGEVTGSEETLQIVDKYAERIGSDKAGTHTLEKGDIVIWNDGSVSVFMGMSNGHKKTWYEVNKSLVEPDGFFARFYNEDNKESLKAVQIIRLHYTL